jgi:hypothetical protein
MDDEPQLKYQPQVTKAARLQRLIDQSPAYYNARWVYYGLSTTSKLCWESSLTLVGFIPWKPFVLTLLSSSTFTQGLVGGAYLLRFPLATLPSASAFAFGVFFFAPG